MESADQPDEVLLTPNVALAVQNAGMLAALYILLAAILMSILLLIRGPDYSFQAMFQRCLSFVIVPPLLFGLPYMAAVYLQQSRWRITPVGMAIKFPLLREQTIKWDDVLKIQWTLHGIAFSGTKTEVELKLRSWPREVGANALATIQRHLNPHFDFPRISENDLELFEAEFCAAGKDEPFLSWSKWVLCVIDFEIGVIMLAPFIIGLIKSDIAVVLVLGLVFSPVFLKVGGSLRRRKAIHRKFPELRRSVVHGGGKAR